MEKEVKNISPDYPGFVGFRYVLADCINNKAGGYYREFDSISEVLNELVSVSTNTNFDLITGMHPDFSDKIDLEDSIIYYRTIWNKQDTNEKKKDLELLKQSNLELLV